jgi:CheY-like chemotaxis protein
VKAKKVFFIADDDPDDRELFIEALRTIDPDCDCITATDGEDALYKLSNGLEQLPDFIFLDLNMPKVNGRECLAIIKKTGKFDQIPVIIYSTSAEEKDIEQTTKSGAAYFLQKPNRFEDLSKALSNIISKDWNGQAK